MTTWYVIAGNGYWGTDRTLIGAFKRWRKHGGFGAPEHRIKVEGGEGGTAPRVDELGRLYVADGASITDL